MPNRRESADTDRAADAEAQSGLADLGELASPVAHQVNNFLNNILLDIAVLEGDLNDSQKECIAEIRRQGRSLAAVVRRWQQYRQSLPERPWQTDLDATIRQAIATLAANPGRLGPIFPCLEGEEPTTAPSNAVIVKVQIQGPPLAVCFPPSELDRLVRFLVNNAVAVSSRGQTVTVAATRSEAGITLIVEDQGPSVPPSQLAELFDPGVLVREETNPLELSACQGLVRRRGGAILAEERTGGGVSIRAILPVEASAST